MDKIKLSTIKANRKNPRIITAEKLEMLKSSITDFKKMLSLRPIVIDENKCVLGGNQRLLALKSLGFKEVPADWIKEAKDLSQEEKRKFILADNVNVGDWDFEALKIDFSMDELNNLGIQIPPLELDFSLDEQESKPKKEKEQTIITCPNCGCELDMN